MWVAVQHVVSDVAKLVVLDGVASTWHQQGKVLIEQFMEVKNCQVNLGKILFRHLRAAPSRLGLHIEFLPSADSRRMETA